MVLSSYDYPALSRNNSKPILKNTYYFSSIYRMEYFLDLQDSLIISLDHSTFTRP